MMVSSVLAMHHGFTNDEVYSGQSNGVIGYMVVVM